MGLGVSIKVAMKFRTRFKTKFETKTGFKTKFDTRCCDARLGAGLHLASWGKHPIARRRLYIVIWHYAA
jgi:hypothetical protein